jgi:hypothetical protein
MATPAAATTVGAPVVPVPRARSRGSLSCWAAACCCCCWRRRRLGLSGGRRSAAAGAATGAAAAASKGMSLRGRPRGRLADVWSSSWRALTCRAETRSARLRAPLRTRRGASPPPAAAAGAWRVLPPPGASPPSPVGAVGAAAATSHFSRRGLIGEHPGCGPGRGAATAAAANRTRHAQSLAPRPGCAAHDNMCNLRHPPPVQAHLRGVPAG